jgi:hypothetical protein
MRQINVNYLWFRISWALHFVKQDVNEHVNVNALFMKRDGDQFNSVKVFLCLLMLSQNTETFANTSLQ